MHVTLYALSTCGWCRKTKRFLDSNDITYAVHDVDLLEGDEKEQIREELARHNPRKSYPTLVVDDGAQVVVGYDEDKLREALKL